MKSLRTRTNCLLLVAAAAACAANGASAASASWAATRTQAVNLGSLKVGSELAANSVVHVSVSLKLRNESELDSIVDRILAGTSSTKLSAQQVQSRYAATQAQADAVAAYLRDAGFTNIDIASNRMIVSADGTAAAIKAAFNTALRQVEVQGRQVWANESPAQVPASLAGIVNAVHGLDMTNPLHLNYKLADKNASVVNPDTVVGHNPLDFPQIYDASSLPTGSKTTIAIMSAGNISQTITDLAAFVSQNKLQAPNVKQIPVGPQSGDTAGVIEWDLDSQTSLGTSGGIKQMVFYIVHDVESLQPFVVGFNQAAADNLANIVNASLGTCEIGEKNNGDESSIDASMKMGVAQGQTFTISSGDSGARECSNVITGGESYPSVSPYATSIGGTFLTTTGNTVYASETVWAGGGGGMSVTEAVPTFQKVLKKLKLTGRGTPDIAFDAAPASGAIVVINGGNGTEQVGGTSLAAPLFMGLWSRIQSQNNNALVSPNSALYKYTHKKKNAAAYTHDILAGTNGYPATPGWDLASGYGSFDAADLATFISSNSGW